MKRLFLGVAVVALAGTVALARDRSDAPSFTPAAPSAPAPLYAVDFAADGGRVVRFDPATLRALPGPAVPVHDHLTGWSFSPDRTRLALGTYRGGSIKLVDTVRMRLLGDVDTGVGGPVAGTHWLADRVVAVIGTRVVVVDARTRAVVARRQLGRMALAAAGTRDAFVLLLPTSRGVGGSLLAVVDRRGGVRTAVLPRIVSGNGTRSDRTGLQRYARPALTVDPSGRRAVVIAANDLAAEVDLRSLRVRYHSLAEPVSIVGRLRNWLEPTAAAKGAGVGPRREARWLGERTIAVWGTDDRGSVDARGRGQIRREAAGVRLIDTRDWSVRTLDAAGSEAVAGDDVLLVSAALWDGGERGTYGIGLRAYGPDGSLRFQVLGSAPLTDVQVVGRRAIVLETDHRSGRERYTVLDLASGRVTARLAPRVPFMLLNGPAGRWLP